MTKIISWLGTSLGVDAEYFVMGGMYGVMQQAVGLVCGLVITYVFGQFVPPSVFGEYNLVLAIISLLAIVSVPGMNTAVLRSVGAGHDRSLLTAVKLRLMWSILGIPILMGLAYYYQQRGSDVVPAMMLLTAGFFPLIYPLSTTQAFFVAKKRFDLQAVSASLSSVVTAVLVGLAIMVKQNLFLALGGYFIGIVLPGVISFNWAKKLVNPKTRPDPGLLNYGYFLTSIQILPLIAAHLGSILLGLWLGMEQLAVFMAASKFPGIVQKNFDVFYKPVTAKLAGQAIKHHQATVRHHLIKFVVLGIGLFGVTWLLLPGLINIFFSHEYSGVISYARWYSLTLLVLPVSWLFSDLVILQKRKKPMVILQTVLPVVKLLSYVIIIPRWRVGGLIGIMLAERTLSTIYSGIMVMTASARKDS